MGVVTNLFSLVMTAAILNTAANGLYGPPDERIITRDLEALKRQQKAYQLASTQLGGGAVVVEDTDMRRRMNGLVSDSKLFCQSNGLPFCQWAQGKMYSVKADSINRDVRIMTGQIEALQKRDPLKRLGQLAL